MLEQLLLAGFMVVDGFADVVVGPAAILLAVFAATFATAAPFTGKTDAEDVDETADAAVVDVAADVPTTDAATVLILCESSLCHLALLWRAAFICVHNSFLHDLDLQVNKYWKINIIKKLNH